MDRVALGLSALAALAGGALLLSAGLRVSELAAHELDEAGEWTALAAGQDAILLETQLEEGEDVRFEVCANDTMDAARWTGAVAFVLEAGPGGPLEQVVRAAADATLLDQARRGASDACVELAHGPVRIADRYVVRATEVTSAVAGVSVRARAMADRPLGARERNGVFGILLAAMLLVVGLALRAPSAPEQAAPAAWSRAAAIGAGAVVALLAIGLAASAPHASTATWVGTTPFVIAAVVGALGVARGWRGAVVVLGVAAYVELGFVLNRVTPPGPGSGLAAGLALVAIEVGLAAALIGGGTRRAALGWQRPERAVVAWSSLIAAPFVGIVLRILAMRAVALVPSTGEAPIEAFVSWPSGLLSFAALSTVAPIGEELFFRGFVYGALAGDGSRARSVLAFLGAWLLFVIAHLPQTWGSWGGLLAIGVAGLGFTALRAATGSVLVSSLAHLVYNGLLAAAALTVG